MACAALATNVHGGAQNTALFHESCTESLFPMMCSKKPVLIVTVLLLFAMSCANASIRGGASNFPLQHNWSMESACVAGQSGAQISIVGFQDKNWHHAEVPTTVVAALVADQTYPDPYYGQNMRSLPGMNYGAAPTMGLDSFFANQDMPDGSPFRCAWWFRTEFNLPSNFDSRRVWLHFDALNYRANVWVNGTKIANAEDVAGTFRTFEFEISSQLLAGKQNALAVEIFAPQKTDLGITWVDWNPTPPDKNMGLWKDVYLTASGPVVLRHPFVQSKLNSAYTRAELTLMADVQNTSDDKVDVQIRGEIEGRHVSQLVTLNPRETRAVLFTPEQYPQLKLASPRLWWPYQMGRPELYQARFSAEIGGKISDLSEMQFGIREVTSELTDKGYRLFRVNGRKIL